MMALTVMREFQESHPQSLLQAARRLQGLASIVGSFTFHTIDILLRAGTLCLIGRVAFLPWNLCDIFIQFFFFFMCLYFPNSFFQNVMIAMGTILVSSFWILTMRESRISRNPMACRTFFHIRVLEYATILTANVMMINRGYGSFKITEAAQFTLTFLLILLLILYHSLSYIREGTTSTTAGLRFTDTAATAITPLITENSRRHQLVETVATRQAVHIEMQQ
eukprot:TRINITY_DN76855_c0_g1_i3.p1 TRINITY_DN76855_c0_g1~~TRINITY_DN76855_c0_g1_i3.p1  ORF type:complete len:222 (+),score=12.97 TRINITY_DN76855_c0_g1_i3:442-1107(+)